VNSNLTILSRLYQMQELERKSSVLSLKVVDDSIADQIIKIQSKRDDIQKQVPEKYLALYKKIAGVRGGVGVAKLNASQCGECNMALPPQFVIDLVRSPLIEQCPHCKRILYPYSMDISPSQ